MELNADRPLPCRDEPQLGRVGADAWPLLEAVVGAGTLERVGEDASFARLDGLAALTIAHRHRVLDVLASVRRNRIGGDVEQIRLAALADLGAARRPAVGAREKGAKRGDEKRTARRGPHDW